MPKKGKIKSINVSKKWKTWYIKSKSKTSIVLSYHEFLFHIISLFILSIILCYLGKSFGGPGKSWSVKDLPKKHKIIDKMNKLII